MCSKNRNEDILKNLERSDLSDVSGGYVGVDTEVEGRYHALVKKAKNAFKDGDDIITSFSEEDRLDLDKFYGQVSKSGKPWYDRLQDMITNQANGVDYEEFKNQT